MGIAAFSKTQRGATYAAELTPETAEALINGLGQSQGPELVDLDAVPLAGIDLSPLANNRGITKLMMSQSGSSLNQWKQLESMQWLTRLDVKDCTIDDAAVKWVLQTFPNLQHFAFTQNPGWMYGNASGGIRQLEIVDKPNLRLLDFGDDSTAHFSSLRIVNAPNLALALSLRYAHRLEISGAPSITGLAVHDPVPPGAKLEGIRNLNFFAVGGPGVTDDFIAPLADCESLSLITLAYPGVTADGLRNLKCLAKVSSLNLPGCPVDDSVVASWPDFNYVTDLDSSDTLVTGVSVKRLLASKSATRVVLAQTPAAAAGPQPNQPLATGSRPSAPPATQFGRWLGGLLSGGPSNADQDLPRDDDASDEQPE